MRIALINQTFYPDVASSGQHLTDLALRLAERGHEVTVITSRRAYDDPGKLFPKRECWRGIQIYRMFNTGLGKRAKWRRAADFATFIWSSFCRLCLLPRQDLLVAMTSPPLISFVVAFFAWVRRSGFCYWIMDLNPDEALAAGWLRPESTAARWLERCSRFSLRRAAKVIVLDPFMGSRITEKGIENDKLVVIPPWSHDSEVRFDADGRERFRKAHGLEAKFVVMYSGNHSPCHPLQTVLAAVKALAPEKEIVFCFVGGGTEFKRVEQFAAEHLLLNVCCLPYQPMEHLSGSLSAADLHLVVMGNPFVGLVHPCKIYNIMRIGSPLLYIGPEPSHVSRIFDEFDRELACASAAHGEVDLVIEHIKRLKVTAPPGKRYYSKAVTKRFSVESLLPRMVETLEMAGAKD